MRVTLRILGIGFILFVIAPGVCNGESSEKRHGTDDRSGCLNLGRIFTSEEFEVEDFGPARWLEDGSGYTTLEDSNAPKERKPASCGEGPEDEMPKDIVRYEPETGVREIIVPSTRLIPEGESQPLKIEDYFWSRGRKKLLVFTNTQRVWRKNTRGDYWVLDLANWDLRRLGGDAEPSTLMFAKFSPDGSRVAYVRERNLYIQNLEDLRVRQLTEDGSDTIINGTSDWVYEEEFSLRDGFRWSPNGKFIAYWQFNTEGVRDFHLIDYTKSLYPEITTFKYPKVGETNSACRVGVIRSRGGETRWFNVSEDPRNHYIPRMEWAENSKTVVLQHLNRLQNTNNVILGNARSGRLRTILTERDEAWIDVGDDIVWLDDGQRFAWLSERDGWRHLYLISRSGRKVTLLTPGEYDVIDVLGIDRKNGWAYYIASPENPAQRYLYRAPLDGSGTVEQVTPENQEGTHRYTLSPDSKWAFHTYSSMDEPPVIDLVRLPSHTRVRVLEDNAPLRERLSALKKRPTEFFRVDVGDGIVLDGWCIKPPDFDPRKRYPLLFYVYGEPAGQTVLDRWGGEKYLWHLMLAQQGYLVVSVDNRGTPAPRGRAWRKWVYRQIGILASADQAAVTRAILKHWPYVDPDRIGIWGWSGGGSMSLNAIFRYPDLYQTAMAIAFVSNQRFYDTIYQERYMGLPEDNEEGYKNGSPITFAHQLEGHLLIVHGTCDDNVHYQSCEALINELIKHNKNFSMMAYPGRSHSIKEGENTKRHLFELLTRYLKENLTAGPKSAGRSG
jgi:dipeptidyl-peptidase-4